MVVRKINNNWYVDFRFNRERIRKKSPENSKAGAQAYEALYRQRLIRGEGLEQKEEKNVPLFQNFAWEWHKKYALTYNSESEVKGKESTLRLHLIPFFGRTRIDRINSMQIDEYKAKMVKTSLSNKSINNHLTILSKCLRTAHDWEIIEKLPKITKLKVEPVEVDFLTLEECASLLKYARGVWREMILVALHTGMRRGELLALSWKDIIWQKKLIAIRHSMYEGKIKSTKSNKIRYVSMSKDVYNCLSRRKEDSGFIFSDNKKNDFSARRLNDELDKVCKRAGLRKITPHKLRHTFASQLAMAGVSIQAIQGLLGHSDIKTTMMYAHLGESSYRDAINSLPIRIDNNEFGQYMGNEDQMTSAFERVLRVNNIDKSANIKQKQFQ